MEYDSLPSVEGLLLDLGGARELQRNGRRRRGDQDAITASRSDGSISEEQGEKDGPLSTPPASVEGSETGYELAKPLLFDDCHTDRLRRCRYSIRDEQKADFTSDIAPPHLNALYSSTTDGRTCESSDGARRDPAQDQSAGKGIGERGKRDGNTGASWEDIDTQPHEEGERSDRDGDQSKTHFLFPTKKRIRSPAGERSAAAADQMSLSVATSSG